MKSLDWRLKKKEKSSRPNSYSGKKVSTQLLSLKKVSSTNVLILFLSFAEDFAQNVELTEEEQIRLLSEYENEHKKTETKKSKKPTLENDPQVDELNVSVKKDMVIVGDTGSSQMSTSSGDTEGKDTGDDWEKDFELEDTEAEAAAGLK